MSGLQRLQGKGEKSSSAFEPTSLTTSFTSSGFSLGLCWQCVRYHRRTSETKVGELTGEIPEGKALLGKHRKKWKLKQYSTQGALAFNEENEIHRCRIDSKTVSR